MASYAHWSKKSWLELHSIVELYNQLIIKSSSSIAIRKTTIKDFDLMLADLSTKIDELKTKSNSQFDFEQDYEAAAIAGEQLILELTTQHNKYKAGEVGIDKFRTNCGASIQTALETDLAKQHIIWRTLVAFLNVIVGLTIVVPVVTRITTGRWGIFTNAETKSEKLIMKMSDVLIGLEESEKDKTPTTQNL